MNLYTFDLICHGVPSRKYLNKDLSQYNTDISLVDNIRFRWKNPKRLGKSLYMLVFSKRGKTKDYMYSSSYDPYFASFMRGESFRYSCYQCKYANMNRIGDITIGDCDSASYYPGFFDGESKSTVIINTEAGMSLWNDYNEQFHFSELNIEREASINHQLRSPLSKPQSRLIIYKDINELPFSEFRKKYAAPTSRKQKLVFFIQKNFPSLYKYLMENK